MQTVYSKEVTAEIERIRGRMAEIQAEIERELTTATAISEFETQRQRNPYYNPLREDREYQLLQAQLTMVIQTAIPKYILTLEEYEAIKRSNKAIAGGERRE